MKSRLVIWWVGGLQTGWADLRHASALLPPVAQAFFIQSSGQLLSPPDNRTPLPTSIFNCLVPQNLLAP